MRGQQLCPQISRRVSSTPRAAESLNLQGLAPARAAGSAKRGFHPRSDVFWLVILTDIGEIQDHTQVAAIFWAGVLDLIKFLFLLAQRASVNKKFIHRLPSSNSTDKLNRLGG